MEVLKINLIEKYQDEFQIRERFQSFREFKKDVEKITDSNSELGFKTGDIIKFMGGYNGDIEFTSEILGFDEDGHAFVLWDCYWFPINLKERLVK